jgi:hypothetical protein
MKLKINILNNISKKFIFYILFLILLNNYKVNSVVILKRENEASKGSRWMFWNYGPNGERKCANLCILSIIIFSLLLITCVCFCIWIYNYKTKSTKNGSEPTLMRPISTRTPALIGEQYGAAEKFTRDNPPQEDLPPDEDILEIQNLGGARAWEWVNQELEQKVSLEEEGNIIKFLGNTDVIIQTSYPFFLPIIDGKGFTRDEDNQIKYSEEMFEQPPSKPYKLLHYYEVTVMDNEDPRSINIAIGLATKPYPNFRLPGHNLYSVGYHSINGKKYNNDNVGVSYGPEWLEAGDTVGCGYYSDTGDIFFTFNGDYLDTAFTGLKHTWFPSIGANGPCVVETNFGDNPENEFKYKDAKGYGPGGPILLTLKSKRKSRGSRDSPIARSNTLFVD